MAIPAIGRLMFMKPKPISKANQSQTSIAAAVLSRARNTSTSTRVVRPVNQAK